MIGGMSNNDIDKFCLTAPTKRALITQFADAFDLRRSKAISQSKTEVHHEETGGHRLFHHESVKSYGAALLEFVDIKDLLASDSCYDIMTHSILADDSDLLQIEKIGHELYNGFLEERKSDGSMNVWDILKKR